ncbi:hypothetical protein ACO1PK_00690 [Alishewanella sp. d11]|uniref:hypothetical protein n=1 Tax=Alishewanella sp. d11 TaxID=3414030 RepID=UPI003BF7B121
MIYTDDKYFAHAVLNAIKQTVTARELYVRLHGCEPSRQELQQLVNRLNPARSNPSAEALGEWLAVLPELHGTTLAQFFKLPR